MHSTLGQFADVARWSGVAGVVALALLILGRQLITGKILSRLSQAQSFAILGGLIATSGLVGVAGIAASVVTSTGQPQVSPSKAPSIAGPASVQVGAQSAQAIQNARTINNVTSAQGPPQQRSIDPAKLVFDPPVSFVEQRRAWPSDKAANATVRCRVSVAHRLVGCVPFGAEPAAYGQAMAKLLSGRRVASLDAEGNPTANKLIMIPAAFAGNWDGQGIDWHRTEFDREADDLTPPSASRPEASQ